MIRSNVGNIATNAIQTMAISGTTAAEMKQVSADRRLNNTLSGRDYFEQHPDEAALIGEQSAKERVFAAKQQANYSDEEKQRIADAEKKRKMETVRQTETGYNMPGVHITNEGQEKISEKRDMNTIKTLLDVQSPQSFYISENVSSNINWFDKYERTSRESGDRFVKTKNGTIIIKEGKNKFNEEKDEVEEEE